MRKVRIERNLMLMTTTLYKGAVMDLDDPLVPPHIIRDIENELVHKTGTVVEIVPTPVVEQPDEDVEETSEVIEDAEDSDEAVEDSEKVSPMRRRKQGKK